MDILQSYQRDIPEQKDEKEKDQTGKDQESDENSLLGFNLQKPLQFDCGMRIAEYGIKKSKLIFLNPQSEIRNLLLKDSPYGDGVSSQEIPDAHPPLPF
jgi:hypothetical protein